MPYVGFKRGLQASIDSMSTANIVDGQFYLTTDSNRLYVGYDNAGSKSLRLLNQTIQIIQSQDNLPDNPNKNDVYYLSNENVLAIYNGSTWVQINPDTKVSRNVIDVGSAVDNNKVTITSQLYHNRGDGQTTPISGSMKVATDGGISLSTTDGNPDTLTVTGTTYSIDSSASSNSGTITLKDSRNGSSSIKIDGGTNIDIQENASGNIEISAVDTINAQVTAAYDAASGKITVSVKDSKNNTKSGTTDALYYTVNGVNYNIGSELPVYTEDEIEEKFKALNSLTYKGTVGNGAGVVAPALPTSGVKIGDMYMVSGEAGADAGYSATGSALTGKTGDLFIATIASGKTEGSDQTIASSDIRWTLVPSGDDTAHDTIYKFVGNATNNSLTISATDNSSNSGSISVAAGTAMEVSSTVSGSGNNQSIAITVTHDDVECNPTTDSESNLTSVQAIDSITVNDQGHVTGYRTKTFGLKTYALGNTTVSAANNVATITEKLIDGVGADVNSKTHTISSESLTVTGSNSNVAINLEWGTF